jgi:protein-disulfide isomerase
MLIALIFSCISIGLAVVLTTFIHSYCIMCILSYGINFALLFFTALTRRRFGTGNFIDGLRRDINFFLQKKIKTAAVFLPFLFIVCVLAAIFPAYWHMTPKSDLTNLSRGITDDGHPWIGAENPELTIAEFSDYLCFQCKKMHYYLRQIVAQNPTKIRLVHRHFPMDHEVNLIVRDPFHIGAGKMALTAIYATSQGKFWEMNDLLFELAGNEKEMNFDMLGVKIGLNSKELARAIFSQKMQQILKIDIWTALKHRMVGTPSYLIDGKVYQGQLPPGILKKLTG